MARMEQFRSAGKTIVFVSHAPEDVKRFAIGPVYWILVR